MKYIGEALNEIEYSLREYGDEAINYLKDCGRDVYIEGAVVALTDYSNIKAFESFIKCLRETEDEMLITEIEVHCFFKVVVWASWGSKVAERLSIIDYLLPAMRDEVVDAAIDEAVSEHAGEEVVNFLRQRKSAIDAQRLINLTINANREPSGTQKCARKHRQLLAL